MKHLLSFACAMALAGPVSATTVASFMGNFSGTVATVPGQELLYNRAGLVDEDQTTMSGAGVASTSTTLPSLATQPEFLGTAGGFIDVGSVSADAQTNGVGEASAVAAYVSIANFENFGNTTETVTLDLTYSLSASSSTTNDPGITSMFESLGALDIEIDGTNVFERKVGSSSGVPLDEVNDVLSLNFTVDPGQQVQLRVSIAGGAQVSEELSAQVVPLPAGGLLLLAGLAGLGVMRRKTRA